MRFRSIVLLCLLSFICRPVWAQADILALESQLKELTQIVRTLQSTVEAQQQTIASQQQQLKALQSQAIEQPVSVASPQTTPMSSTPKTQGRWNPDIGVVMDTVALVDSPKLDEEGADRVSVRELELTFGSNVDPYSRLDATLGISDFEEMEIEEAYLTRYDLPLSFTARIGRFLPRIGKIIPAHRDSLETVDLPLVIEHYFGHHGYNKTGVDITRSLDMPWDITHQWTIGILEGGNGEEGNLFGETRRHPTLYTSLKNSLDISDESTLDIGLSYLSGSRDDDENFETQVIGVDGTWVYRYADQQHVKLQSEGYYVNRSESFYELDGPAGEIFYEDLDDARHLWGAYVLADWRFHPMWATGFRFDDVQLIEDADNFANTNSTQRQYSAYVTFYQSEFARWRAQYTHVDNTSGEDDNRLMLQGTFAIGEHKHKIQA